MIGYCCNAQQGGKCPMNDARIHDTIHVSLHDLCPIMEARIVPCIHTLHFSNVFCVTSNRAANPCAFYVSVCQKNWNSSPPHLQGNWQS